MSVLVVNTVTDIVDAGDGLTSLREALATATLTVGPDTILFDSALDGATLDLASRLVFATGTDVTVNGDIDGDGLADITLSGRNAVSHVWVQAGANVTLTGFVLAEGRSTGTEGSRGSTGSHIM